MVEFYTAALGYVAHGTAGETLPVDRAGRRATGRSSCSRRCPRPRSVKNRVHLDLIVGDDIEAEAERFVALGRAARLARSRSARTAAQWIVMPTPRATNSASATADVTRAAFVAVRATRRRARRGRAATDVARLPDVRPHDARAVAHHVAVPRQRRRHRRGRGRAAAVGGACRHCAARRRRRVPERAARPRCSGSAVARAASCSPRSRPRSRAALAPLGHAPEARRFHPHLTLGARAKRRPTCVRCSRRTGRPAGRRRVDGRRGRGLREPLATGRRAVRAARRRSRCRLEPSPAAPDLVEAETPTI